MTTEVVVNLNQVCWSRNLSKTCRTPLGDGSMELKCWAGKVTAVFKQCVWSRKINQEHKVGGGGSAGRDQMEDKNIKSTLPAVEPVEKNECQLISLSSTMCIERGKSDRALQPTTLGCNSQFSLVQIRKEDKVCWKVSKTLSYMEFRLCFQSPQFTYIPEWWRKTYTEPFSKISS